MLTLSTNIQSYLSAIRLSSTTQCFHPSNLILCSTIITWVLLYENVRIISEFDFVIARVWCVSGVNLTFIFIYITIVNYETIVFLLVFDVR